MFILECEGNIYGVGATVDDALADAREFVDVPESRVVVVSHPRQHYPAGACAIWPATSRLIDVVRHDSFGVRWSWNHDVGAADVALDS
jgi:hypothetical protein